MNVEFAKPEEREEVLAWVRAQAGHEDYSFLNWSDVLVVRDASGIIRAVSELAAIQTAEFVFDVSGGPRSTWSAWQAFRGYFDSKRIDPVVIADSKSKMTPYVARVLRRAFVGFEFFKIGS